MPSRYRLLMTQARGWNFVLRSRWLSWRRPGFGSYSPMPNSFSAVNERNAMAVNHFTELFPTPRLLATMVAFSFAGIIAVGAMALIAWIGLALLGF